MKRNAFTMLEMVFVIVVLGILAAIAVPKLAVTRDDAQIVKGRSDVSAIRTAIINERQTRLLRGESAYISHLHNGDAGDFTTLFDHNGTEANSLLQYGVTTENSRNGHWDDTVTNNNGRWQYTYHVMDVDVVFDYNAISGKFDCNHSVNMCKSMTE